MYIVILIIVSALIGALPLNWFLAKFITGKLRYQDKIKKMNLVKKLLTKFSRGHDIRKHGSQNPGASNFWRVMGAKMGLITGLVDIAKAFLLVYFLVPKYWGPDSVYLVVAGASCLLGNTFNIFFKGRGGKAVAAATGVFLALMPLPLLIAFVFWGIVMIWKGIVSIASLVAVVVLFVSYLVYLGLNGMAVFGADEWSKTVFAMLLMVLIFYNHRTNIKKWLKGEENSFKSNKAR